MSFITSYDDAPMEFIDGLLDTYSHIEHLDGCPQTKVVVRGDILRGKNDKVAVISGGGSGHEPAHAGYVGEGMLAAAIAGDLFVSPPIDSILAGIRAVTGPKGCLLIVKNYTGDRLNFGLAAEKAKAEDYKVEMVIVGDDCALPPSKGIAGRRGLAGTVLVHKVAGAAAAAGLPLADVTAEAKKASELVGTVGVARSVSTFSERLTGDRIHGGKIELGLGIHGESGHAKWLYQNVDLTASRMLSSILSSETNYVPIRPGDRVVLMTNGLGGTSLMELMIATSKITPRLQLDYGLAVDRVYTGSFMTSLDMKGFSITLMKATPEILLRLDAPTKAPYWPVTTGRCALNKLPISIPPSSSRTADKELKRPQHLTAQACLLEAAIEAAADAIIKNKETLDKWDSEAGDGDCGFVMSMGATAINVDMKFYPLNDVAETVHAIGASISRVMGGTSGIMYTIFCNAVYAKLKENDEPSVATFEQWIDAFDLGISKISMYGGAREGYRTMLDALIPAAAVLRSDFDAGVDPISAFVHASEAATDGAKSTQYMEAQAGRSTYIRAEELTTVPDPGAMAVSIWLSAAALAVKEKAS